MKVLGTTQNGYILSGSRDEIAHLQGFYYLNSYKNIKPGDEIDIKGLYNKVRSIEFFLNKDTQSHLNNILHHLNKSMAEISFIKDKNNYDG